MLVRTVGSRAILIMRSDFPLTFSIQLLLKVLLLPCSPTRPGCSSVVRCSLGHSFSHVLVAGPDSYRACFGCQPQSAARLAASPRVQLGYAYRLDDFAAPRTNLRSRCPRWHQVTASPKENRLRPACAFRLSSGYVAALYPQVGPARVCAYTRCQPSARD